MDHNKIWLLVWAWIEPIAPISKWFKLRISSLKKKKNNNDKRQVAKPEKPKNKYLENNKENQKTNIRWRWFNKLQIGGFKSLVWIKPTSYENVQKVRI